jgi:hypothetical protein
MMVLLLLSIGIDYFHGCAGAVALTLQVKIKFCEIVSMVIDYFHRRVRARSLGIAGLKL